MFSLSASETILTMYEAERNQIYDRLREVKRIVERFAKLDRVYAGRIRQVDVELVGALGRFTKTITRPMGTSLRDVINELPAIDRAEEALVLTLEPLFNTDQAQCLAKSKALSEVLGASVGHRAIAFVFKGLLDPDLIGDERQLEIDQGLRLLDEVPIPAALMATVALVEAHWKAFVPFSQYDVFSTRRSLASRMSSR